MMGSGKTSAAINFMNSNPQRRFIYITPQLTEDDRIVAACPALRFVKPDDSGPNQTKKNDLMHNLHARHNIASTHALFKLCDDEVAKLLRQNDYTMIIDEAVNATDKFKMSKTDVKILVDSGIFEFKEDGEVIVHEEKVEAGPSRFGEALRLAKSHKLVRGSNGAFFQWVLTDTMLRACQLVIVLTYRFRASTMRCLMEEYKIPYRRIYVRRHEDGACEFCDALTYLPEVMGRMSTMLEIEDDPILNDIYPKDPYALSKNWYKKQITHRKTADRSRNANGRLRADQTDGLDLIESRLRSYFGYKFRDIAADDRLWTVFKEAYLEGKWKGFKQSFLRCNATSVNTYGDRHLLAFMINVFVDPNVGLYFQKHNVHVAEDEYALALMVQWIWRSAIRNGEKVHVYVPSTRMRNMLKAWITECEQEYKSLYGDQAVAPVDINIKEDNT